VANILTTQEAANALRCATDDPAMLDLLPMVDAAIAEMTGHNWAADSTKSPLAKAAARILLVQWHEDPGMMAARNASLPFGLTQTLISLATNLLPEPDETETGDQIGAYVGNIADNLP
jgi:hypothetical protein